MIRNVRKRQRLSFGLNVASFTGNPYIQFYINNIPTGNMVPIRNNGQIAADLIYDLVSESGQTTTTLGFRITDGTVTLAGPYGINAYITIECFAM